MQMGFAALVAVSIAIVALTISSSGDAKVELLATQHGISRSAVEGDGFVDSAWSDVWKRKPAQFKAVSQELSSYDDVEPKAGSKLDASQAKAEHELAGYLQVTKSLLGKEDSAQLKASTDPAAIKQIPASQWSAKQQLEDAEAHDQELNSYSNILNFSPKDSTPKAAPKAAAAKVKGGSYDILDFPFPAYKAWYTTKKPAEQQAPKPSTLQLEAKEKSELNSYNLLNFPDATQKKAAAQPVAAAPQSKAKEAPAAAGKAAPPAPKAAKAAVAHGAAKTAVTAAAQAAVVAQRPAAAKAEEEEEREYANPTPFTGLLEVGGGAVPVQQQEAWQALAPAPQPAAILIEPPPAQGSTPLARKWRAVWRQAQRLQQMALHPPAPAPAAPAPAPAAPAPAAPKAAKAEGAAATGGAGAGAEAERQAGRVRGGQARVQAQAAAEGECEECAAVWSEGALACVEACAARHSQRPLSPLDKDQLRINDAVARLLRKYLGPDSDALGKQVLVQGFVRPVVDGGVPSWVSVEGEHEGLRGLGLGSGRTVDVALHGTDTLSAKRLAAEGSGVSFEAALAPLMAEQEALNERRVRGGAHVLEGFEAPASLLAWKPHPGLPLPAPAALPNPKPHAKALQTSLASAPAVGKAGAEKKGGAEEGAEAEAGAHTAGRLSSDAVVRGLQLQARALTAQLQHLRAHAPAPKPPASAANKEAESDRALEWVLAAKEAELAEAEEGLGDARPKSSSAQRVREELTRELEGDEARLAAARAAQRREGAESRLVRAEVRGAALQARHLRLLATLRALRPHSPATKAPQQMLAEQGVGAGRGASMSAVEALAEQLSHATHALHALHAVHGHTAPADKARALHLKLAAARGVGVGGRAARMREAVARDEAALEHSADFLPALSRHPAQPFAVPRASPGDNGDGTLRADVEALLGATRVADPKEYHAMLEQAIAKEEGAVARYRSAESFADKVNARDLTTADETFDALPTQQAVRHVEGDPAVAAAMEAAHRIEKEMHIAFPHADQRKAAAAEARRRKAAREREEEREGKFIPGIGEVKEGGESDGASSLSAQLWKHHLVPVAQAVAQAAPPLVRPPRGPQPKLAADGGLRAKEAGARAGAAPSG